MLKKTTPFFTKNLLWIFLLIVAVISSSLMKIKMQGEGWRFAVYMDGRGYYAQLPAYFIYNDPQYKFYTRESALPDDPPNFMNDLRSGKKVNKYFAGEAFLLSPFFGVAHLVARNAGYPANGFSPPYFYAVAIAAIFYFLLGLFFLWRLLEKFQFRKSVILLVCTCFAFGTNLFHYAVYEPSMSHIYSFAAISCFLYLLRCYFLSPSAKILFGCAFVFGIMLLLRPINAVVFLAFPVMAGDVKNLRNGFQWIMKHWKAVAVSVCIVGLVGFIQLFLYRWATGNYFIYAYEGEGFDFLHPHFHATLFSFEKGLVVYTPMILFAFFGLVVLFKRSKFLFLNLFFLLMIIAWIVSSWHEYKYGYSFGLRAYIDYYALFALAMAFFIDWTFRKKIVAAVGVTLYTLVIIFYGIQQYQFVHRIIHPGAMNEKAYWQVFLKTGKVYEGMITENNLALPKESNGDFNDMEGDVYWPGMETVVSGPAHSGTKACKIDSAGIYSCCYMKYMTGDDRFNDNVLVEVEAYIYLADENSSAELQVAGVQNNDLKFLQYFHLPWIPPRKWTLTRKFFIVPGVQVNNESIKIFFKRNSGTVYIDDFKVHIKEK
jgi:hypothetical protein